jgi:hypothetical protein
MDGGPQRPDWNRRAASPRGPGAYPVAAAAGAPLTFLADGLSRTRLRRWPTGCAPGSTPRWLIRHGWAYGSRSCFRVIVGPRRPSPVDLRLPDGLRAATLAGTHLSIRTRRRAYFLEGIDIIAVIRLVDGGPPPMSTRREAFARSVRRAIAEGSQGPTGRASLIEGRPAALGASRRFDGDPDRGVVPRTTHGLTEPPGGGVPRGHARLRQPLSMTRLALEVRPALEARPSVGVIS